MFNASVNTPTGHHILGPCRALEFLNTSHSALLQKPNNDPWLNLGHINMSTPNRDSQLKIQDEGRLEELGYKQQLDRSWGCLHNCGACFSIISVITGITTLFSYGLNTGGPAIMSVGWIIVCFFTLLVCASMAEILSAIPISGGPYFWAYMLAPSQHAPFFAWITGWFNLIGQIAATTGIDFGLANLISTTASVSNGYEATAPRTLGILALILVSQVAVNLLSMHKLRYMIYTSIILNSFGVMCLLVAVLNGAPSHQSAGFVFGKFFDGTAENDGAEGWSVRASPAYVAVAGVLMSQYAFKGYDSSAHLCEETRRAVHDAPRGLLAAGVASICLGFFVIVALLFSIQDFDTVRKSPLPVLQILTDACGHRGGVVLMVLIMLCAWHCGLFNLTSNSRMMFAFARDGAIPHSLHMIDHRFKSPVRTIIFAATCSFLLALPILGSQVAFNGTTSIATISLYISYGIPIAMTLLFPRNFKRGAFTLGRASKPIALVSSLWISFIIIAFCLPTITPLRKRTLNYTPIAVGIVGNFAFGSWFLWARKWFTGRCRDHCRVCIRSLDFLGQEMVDRPHHNSHNPHRHVIDHFHPDGEWDHAALQRCGRESERFGDSDRGSDQKSQITMTREFELRQDQGV
ncbi:MAG: hypothetical protein LQ339_009011 [Xanthoria mediterranea]|nr:MAG: hypothetical protein LQ339_009011 [Xanthoria mediterranea]